MRVSSLFLIVCLALAGLTAVSADSSQIDALDRFELQHLQQSMKAWPSSEIMPLVAVPDDLVPEAALEPFEEEPVGLLEGDAEVETEGEADQEVDALVDAEIQAETDAEADMAIAAEVEAELEGQTETDTETETETEAEAETESEAQAESETEAEAEVDLAAVMDVRSLAEVDTSAFTEAELATSAEAYEGVAWTSQIKGGGCGSGITEKLVPDWNMLPACTAHDNCYDTCGSTKANCDTTFYNNMKSLCAKKYAGTSVSKKAGLKVCNAQAYIYYQAVAKFGGSPYKNAQAKKKCPVKKFF